MSQPRSGFAPPLAFSVRPSPRLLIAIGAVQAFFLLPVIWLVVREPITAVLLPLPVLAFALSVRRLAQWSPRAIVRVVWEGDNDWRWHRADGTTARGWLGPAWLRWPWLVVLDLRADDGRREVLWLNADSVGRPTFRRLRARLTLLGAAAADGGTAASG